MDNNPTFMSKFLTFFGLRQDPPVNDFRNPIWGSDDEDEEDELYTRQNMDIYPPDPYINQEFANQMHDVFKSFSSIFGDMRSLFHEERFDAGTNTINIDKDPENYGNSIRDYYLKPGFNLNKSHEPKEDVDLDGKISSHEISGLLNKNEDDQKPDKQPFNSDLVPRNSFFQTIITTSVTNPDGSVETRRIVKNGSGVVEETTTSSTPDPQSPFVNNMDSMPEFMISGVIYNHVMKEFSTLFKNLH